MMKYYFPCAPNRLSPTSDLFRRLDNDPAWTAEVKKNGWRCLAYKEGGALTLWTRHHTTINDPLPEIRGLLTDMLPDGCVIDGELLQNRTKQIKGVYYVFDLLVVNGKSITGHPLWDRRQFLETILWTAMSKIADRGGNVHPIYLATQYQIGKVKLYYDSITGEENEGIVLKNVNSIYNASESRCLQNPHWLKVKRVENHVYTRR
jgi:ATP-dependent DNA ligase